MFRKNKPTLEEQRQKAAQELIPLKALDAGLILTPDNRLVQIMKVSAINVELMSKAELHLLLENYEGFLKSITFPFQQCVVSEPIDLKKYISSMQEKLEHIKSNQRKLLLENYIEYNRSMETSRKIMKRQRYIVVDEVIKGATEKAYEEAIHDIAEKRDHIENGMKDLDLTIEPISNTEIVRLLQIFFNYEGALYQPMQTDIVPPIVMGEPVLNDKVVKKFPKKNNPNPLFEEREPGEPLVIDENNFPIIKVGGEK
jgi:hypothetical protein